MTKIPCPFLRGEVELTGEREVHIAKRHPDLLPEHRHCLIQTLAEPDLVRGGKHLVVVVVSEGTDAPRLWAITAYLARRLGEGDFYGSETDLQV